MIQRKVCSVNLLDILLCKLWLHLRPNRKKRQISASLSYPSRCATIMCEAPYPPLPTWADSRKPAGCYDRRGIRIWLQIFLQLLLSKEAHGKEEEEDCSPSCVVYCLSLMHAEMSLVLCKYSNSSANGSAAAFQWGIILLCILTVQWPYVTSLDGRV